VLLGIIRSIVIHPFIEIVVHGELSKVNAPWVDAQNESFLFEFSASPTQPKQNFFQHARVAGRHFGCWQDFKVTLVTPKNSRHEHMALILLFCLQ